LLWEAPAAKVLPAAKAVPAAQVLPAAKAVVGGVFCGETSGLIIR